MILIPWSESSTRRWTLLCVAAALLVACSGPVDPATTDDPGAGSDAPQFDGIVVTSATDSGPGSLRQAVLEAEPGDEIRFASDMTIVLEGDRRGIEVDKDITINGVGRSVVIEGSGTQRHFTHMPGGPFKLTIANLTLRNGEPRMANLLPGGSVYIGAGSTAEIDTVTFANNLGSNGGAIFVERVSGQTSTLTIRNSVFESNEARGSTGVGQPAGSGGAIYAWNTELIVSGSEFQSNFVEIGNMQLVEAVSGGAILFNSEIGTIHSATIRSSSFESNSAGFYGGAVRADNSNLYIIDSTFTENQAGLNGNDNLINPGTGGAIHALGFGSVRELFIGRTRFIRNRAGGPDNNASPADRRFTGGAVSVVNKKLIVHSSEFFGNVAEDGGATGTDAPTSPNGGSALFVQADLPVVIASSAFVGNVVRGANYEPLAFNDSAAVAFNDPTVGNYIDIRLSTFSDNASPGLYPHFRARAQQIYLSSIAVTDDKVDFTTNWEDDGYIIRYMVAPLDFAGLNLDEAFRNNVPQTPGFVRSPSLGGDGSWGTEDDDYGNLYPSLASNLREAGRNMDLLPDTMDLNGDGDTSQAMPLDARGNQRVRGTVDVGAYEG